VSPLLPEAQPVPAPERARALEALRRFGWNATSFQVLGSGFSYWFSRDESFVAYVDTGRAWVAAGAPVCATENLSAAARAFVSEAARRGRDAVFFATEERAASMPSFASLPIGEQPVWDPRDWRATLARAKSVREQLRRAGQKGVEISRVPAGLLTGGGGLRREVGELVRRWLGARPLPPMGFLVAVDPFSFASERRLFVARRGERLVGFANAVPVYARGGWMLQDLVRAPDAPNGTVEALVDAAMRDAAELGSDYLTLGLAPLAGAVPEPLRLAARCGARLFDFAGLRAFKAKLKPRAWVPIYLTHPVHQHGGAAVMHALSAFAGGSLVRYGLNALLRRPLLALN
jgi:phosphatidylglycerol lysyltransferase